MPMNRNSQGSDCRAALTACAVAFVLAIGVAVAQDKSNQQRPSPSMPDTSIPEKIVPPEQGVPAPPGTVGQGKDGQIDKKRRDEGPDRKDAEPKSRIPAPAPNPRGIPPNRSP